MSFSSMHNDYLDPDRWLWDEEPQECFDEMRLEMGKWFGLEYSQDDPVKIQAQIIKAVYKSTNSGCWLKFVNNCSIQFAGYVEGWEGEVPSCTLSWPFTKAEFFGKLAASDEYACDVFEILNSELSEEEQDEAISGIMF
jgi:hypothetical protein